MNRNMITRMFALLALLAVSAVQAIEFNEVRNFEDVFVISATAPTRDRLEIHWDISDDYYLYNNKFLRFESETDGVVLGEPLVPAGEISFDELLGEEVEKFHEELTIRLPLVSVASGVEAVQLKVRSQGCLENVLCYPPTEQVLLVNLPPEPDVAANVAAQKPVQIDLLASKPADSLADIFNQPIDVPILQPRDSQNIVINKPATTVDQCCI